MHFRISRPSPSLVISSVALFAALGGTGYAAQHADKNADKQLINQVAGGLTVGNAKHLGGQPASAYLGSKYFSSSHGAQFMSANSNQTVTLGKTGHFTFSATCKKDGTGQNVVTFDVTADTTADLDGGGPVPAGTLVNIHTNSDALDTTAAKPLHPGDFDQVGSASSSTEIAADGQEVDVFYNDGVNWPAGNGSSAHDCFAGYTGLHG